MSDQFPTLLKQAAEDFTNECTAFAQFRIENGQFTHAVEEVTIAGNLGDMLNNVTAIGNDLVFRGSVASPTLRIDGMTIAGA